MRIGINALYSMSGSVGGMETYLRNIVRAILKHDTQNKYIFFANKENYEYFDTEQDNFVKVLCPFPKGLGIKLFFWEQCILPFQASKYKVDILFSPVYTSPAFLSCKSVVTIHCMNYYYNPEDYSRHILPYLRIFIPLSARRSDKIITVSNNTKNELIKNLEINAEKIRVIYYGVDKGFSPDLEFDVQNELSLKYGIKGKYILSIAGYRASKNVLSAVKAFNVLKKKYGLEHKLVIVGKEGMETFKIKEFIRECSLASEVLFAGPVPNEKLAPFYCGADLFVFLSLYESFGIPLIEAMACGTPVISSNKTALPEIVGDAGILVDPHNIEAIASQMNRVLSNEQLKMDLFEKGLERAKIFSWDNAAQELLSVFYEKSRKDQ